VKRVVVVGGGVAGLATALHLRDQGREVPGGLEVLVLEAGTKPGGNIRTDRVDGFMIEQGPNGFLDNAPATLELVRRLELESELQRADESAAKRYLFRQGRLHLLPSGPLGFLRSSVLSLPGRLRVFAEPFAPSRPQGVDETVFQFASRRIGEEAAEILVDAMVSGVFAGDVRALSLESSFPRMAAMEEEYGGLVKAMVARMRERRAAKREARRLRPGEGDADSPARPGGPAGPGGTLTSFRSGLDALPEALARELKVDLRLETRVTRLARAGAAEGEGAAPWLVHTEASGSFAAHAVVLAVPSPRAAPLLEPLDRDMARVLGSIPTASLAVVALAFEESELGGAPYGFGFLVPRKAGLRMLGCLWDSSIFPGRAPEGKVLLRAMVGGAHDPEAVRRPERQLVGQVLAELETTMGISAEPLLRRVYRWPLGIGQYTVGHGERMAALENGLAGLGRIWVAGSSFYGISMNACIEKAPQQARQIVDSLSH